MTIYERDWTLGGCLEIVTFKQLSERDRINVQCAGGGRAHRGTEKCIFKDPEHLRSYIQGFSGDSDSKQSSRNAGDLGLIPGSGRSPWRRAWQPTPVFLPGESQGQRSLVGYSPWDHRVGHDWATTLIWGSYKRVGLALWAWGLHSHSRPWARGSSYLGQWSAVAILRFWIIFEQGALHFHRWSWLWEFDLDPTCDV